MPIILHCQAANAEYEEPLVSLEKPMILYSSSEQAVNVTAGYEGYVEGRIDLRIRGSLHTEMWKIKKPKAPSTDAGTVPTVEPTNC